MAKTREKRTVFAVITNEMAEEAFAKFAMADARQQKITAEIDTQVTRIREKYQDKLASYAQEKEEAFDLLQQYAQNNPDLFVKRKSLEMTHGVVGFRTGTPKLKALKGYTWSAVLNLLKEFLPDYVRTAEEPAKDRILADRDKPEVAELFPKVGICVEQDETFYVEPKKEAEPALA